MHVVSRILRARNMATLTDAQAVVTEAITHLRREHDVDLGAGVQFGGDGLAIGITGRYERLADYERFRAAMTLDEDFGKIVRSGEGLFDDTVEDTIWKVRIAPGEAKRFTVVNSARIELERVVDAMAFAADVATTISAITGNQLGFATAQTGDRARIIWVGYGDSLADVEADEDALEADEGYLDLYKRATGLVVPNTLDERIWVRVTD